MNKIPVITIDGPAASGKTSVSRELAQRFSWSWVSTGAFYRGIAFVALKQNVDLNDEAALIKIVNSDLWEVCMSPDRTQFLYNNQDVTDEIYKEEMGSAASQIGQHQKLRRSLLEAQRNCVSKVEGLVAEGRDCGTVVFPDADVKIYLTAKSENRAKRRADEQGASFEEMAKAQKRRDKDDQTRVAAPLQVPENAHVVDTSDMDLQQVVEHVDSIVRAELKI
ncbi:MAG: (d)CMP kinase [Bdellovibrionales bacterium]|nr:(d)CMP kinase [Bdellovibrionales bacterium]